MRTNTANYAWNKLLNAVLAGVQSSPRNKKTIEILSYTSTIRMDSPVITIPERKMNYDFMCGEAHWILSGSNKVNDIEPFMKVIKKFSDNGIHFDGAYGPKVVEQLNYVCLTLLNDIDSRQAVLNIWRENPRPSKDIPCTLNLQFLIRDNELHCVANMRSSDAWLGWVYDVFNFSMISAWIAIYLRGYDGLRSLKLGNLYLHAGSQHLYENNWETANEISRIRTVYENIEFNIDRYESPEDLTDSLWSCGMNYNVDDNFFFDISARRKKARRKKK